MENKINLLRKHKPLPNKWIIKNQTQYETAQYLMEQERLGFNPILYIESSIKFIEFSDIYSSLIKAAVFGMIISTMGCYFGFRASRGALGVGKATTDSVVFSSILILAFNYFLTELLFR